MQLTQPTSVCTTSATASCRTLGGAVKEVFEELKSVEPDVVFTHTRDDLHQDHRLASELTWNTFRHHLILEYEIPKYDGDLGSPNVFVPLEEEIVEEKLRLLAAHYPTQSAKHWFDDELFRGLLRLRGMECASRYAEAFVCPEARTARSMILRDRTQVSTIVGTSTCPRSVRAREQRCDLMSSGAGERMHRSPPTLFPLCRSITGTGRERRCATRRHPDPARVERGADGTASASTGRSPTSGTSATRTSPVRTAVESSTSPTPICTSWATASPFERR